MLCNHTKSYSGTNHRGITNHIAAVNRLHRERHSVGTTSFLLTLVLLILMPSLSQAQIFLQPNTEIGLKPGGFICQQTPNELGSPAGVDTEVEIECAASDAAAVFRIIKVRVQGIGVNEKAAYARHRMQVDIADNSDGTDPSLLPLEVTIPAFEYSFQLLNNVIGALEGISSISIDLRILSTDGSRPIAEKNIISATNGGTSALCVIGGVAAMATGDPTGVLALVGCALDSGLKASGTMNGLALTTMVKAGQSYTVEIAASVFVKKRRTPLAPFHGAEVNQGGFTGMLENLPTVRWNDIILKLGADPQEYVASLEERIEELEEIFATHSHVYQTGKGAGHNKIKVNTSFPHTE